MINVFDLVEDFYAQDEEWNTVLRQKYAEDFLRLKSWQGASEDELLDIWNYMTVMCIYLGNSEHFLGDMTREDFIDCVGWCCRNISDFLPTPQNIGAFLDTMSEMYMFFKKKRVITSDSAPAEAKARLLSSGKVQMLDEEGYFLPEYERYNQYATPDLPNKAFLNIGERLQDLLSSLQTFFGAQKYKRDVERATFLYSGILMGGLAEEKPDSEEYAQTFWDYFLFDYHMLADDKTPLQHFYDDICANGFSAEGMVSKDVLEELLQVRLVLFEVLEKTPEGLYSCRNVLTDERYLLQLPIDGDVDTDGYIFMGHIFYNNTMVMNFVRGMLMNKASRKRFFEVLGQAKDWFAVRSGGEVSWEKFINRNPIFVRHISLLYAAYIRMEGFNYETKVTDYKPQPVLDDRVTKLIGQMMRPYAFSAYDIFLVRTMWSDFLQAFNMPDKLRVSEMWAAGLIYAFIKLNNVYNYEIEQVSSMCYGVPKQTIERTAAAVWETLKLETHDPRYVNEEGLLLMLLQ